MAFISSCKSLAELMAALGGNTSNLNSLGDLQNLYKKNEARIQEEIKKLQKNGGIDKLKEQGKKIFKGIKF
jgi:hypothetical protein